MRPAAYAAPLSDIGLRSNGWIWVGIGAMVLLQLAFTYAPPMNDVFGSAPIEPLAWLRVLGVGVLAFIVVDVEKALRRHAAAARQRIQQQERLAAVGTLAAGLAHEIRNPLNGAQLHVSFLERALIKSPGHPNDPDRRDTLEAVGIVRDEIKRRARLVTDFLDFARPRPLALAETSVRALCERAIQLVSAHARETVAIRLDVPAMDIIIEADRDRLEQVLLNLLQNAVDAVAPRGGNVVLRARRQPRHVSIEVEDDGPGLSPEGAPVFDPFFSTKPNGTGSASRSLTA